LPPPASREVELDRGLRQEAAGHALAIWQALLDCGFCGYDPYDAVSGRHVRRLVGSSDVARRGLVQVARRVPLNLQAGLGVRPAVSAYTLGHAMVACARLSQRGVLPDAEEIAAGLVLSARQRRLRAWPGLSWGYHFDVHTRFFRYHPWTPNIVVTAYMAKGFAALTAAAVADCRKELRGITRFILEALPRRSDQRGQNFGYIPSSDTVIHNANMLGALALVRAGVLCDDPGLIDEAVLAARFTCAHQAPDGSWPYSEQANGRWVDGYHTGFVLEGLMAVVDASPEPDLEEGLRRGLKYYCSRLFGSRGEPYYYPDRPLPYDALSAAQGIETLARAERWCDEAPETLRRLLEWTDANLLEPRGSVAYQVHKHWKDRRQFPRWSMAPMAAALAAVEEVPDGEGTRIDDAGDPRGSMPSRRGDCVRASNSQPVWIDLGNSPQVIFFRPVIAELAVRGVPVTVSARDFAQTLGLCHLYEIPVEALGTHGGAGLCDKAITLAARGQELRAFARRARPRVAVSHNSYAQGVAARSLGLPVVTAMDYEFQPANHLAFRLADLVAVPAMFPDAVLRAQGAYEAKVWKYDGVKEEISLAGFAPDPSYLARHGIDVSRVVVAVRPPADMALYHRFNNELFGEVLALLKRRADELSVILLARTREQEEELTSAGYGSLIWSKEPLDGPNLVAGADLVISAGGSMNREAAVLGTPAFSVYAGRLGAVDEWLAASGKLTIVDDRDALELINFRKKMVVPPPVVGDSLVRQFVDRLLAIAHA